MLSYDPKSIEAKWQARWERDGLFCVDEKQPSEEKYYSLETFPYPSAAGLHVGHPEGYTAEDINVRYRRMRGKNVLYTMGWDAFGLPTENYAIKIGKKPHEVALANIANFKRQVQMFGFSYDWTREINTSAPEYYRWTQWIFLELYKKGLAYRGKAAVNWCDTCKTVLANEQVVDGACERCDNAVIQRQMEQWFFKITDYADDLVSGLDHIDWPESSKEAQRNWIGKSVGALIKFPISNFQFPIEVFTTRPDTLFGATYLVLAPEHPLVADLQSQTTNWSQVEQYIKTARAKSMFERTNITKEKTGVVLEGIFAINPANNEKIPVWVADYVLVSYGTGAIMGVPAHDERDGEFAQKYNLPIREVVQGEKVSVQIYTDAGIMINSGKFDGMPSEEAKWAIMDAVGGARATTYRMRDWLVSRQRYWGAPIPIIFCSHCAKNNGISNFQFPISNVDGVDYALVPVPEKDLPVLLPDDVDFRPMGEPPLASSKSFQGVVCPKCGALARRDFETMDTFVDSSWYYFRYCSPHYQKGPFDPVKVNYWLPTDLYVIGAEHSTKHLLYARFMAKALMDDRAYEPFAKLRHIGLILGADGQKMSKSRGNVVNPDEVVDVFGADAVRMYEMFMGPLDDAKPWSTESIKGISRFLEKVWRMYQDDSSVFACADLTKILHKTIKVVMEDLDKMHYNTAIARMMEFVNEATMVPKGFNRPVRETFLKLLHPFAPHITEELWEILGHKESIIKESWPTYDPTLVTEDVITLPIQIDGKLRATIQIPTDADEAMIKSMALAEPNVQKWLVGKTPTLRYIAGKIISIIT